jgi:uroporphyrinogen decarboxylase
MHNEENELIMNSRDRIRATINHHTPDRIPIDLGSTPITGISGIAYQRLKNYLGILGGHTRIYDLAQQIAIVEDEIIERLHVDVLDIGRRFNSKNDDWVLVPSESANLAYNGLPLEWPVWFHPHRNADGGRDIIAPDGQIIGQMPKNGFYFDQISFPWESGLPGDFSSFPQAMKRLLGAFIPKVPEEHIVEPTYWHDLRQHALWLTENTDKALVANGGGKILESASFLRRMDQALVDCLRVPHRMQELFALICDRAMVQLEQTCKAVGDVVDIIRFSDDLGENNSLLMSPRLYRKFEK